jgi:hypothetical protein
MNDDFNRLPDWLKLVLIILALYLLLEIYKIMFPYSDDDTVERHHMSYTPNQSNNLINATYVH